MELIHMDFLRSWGFLGQHLCLILEIFCPTERCVMFELQLCFLWLQISAEFHNKNSPSQEEGLKFHAFQKQHHRLHSAHGQIYPMAPLSAVRSLRFCRLRQPSSLADSAQDLMFHLVSIVKRIFFLPDADSQEGTIPLRRKA